MCFEAFLNIFIFIALHMDKEHQIFKQTGLLTDQHSVSIGRLEEIVRELMERYAQSSSS